MELAGFISTFVLIAQHILISRGRKKPPFIAKKIIEFGYLGSDPKIISPKKMEHII